MAAKWTTLFGLYFWNNARVDSKSLERELCVNNGEYSRHLAAIWSYLRQVRLLGANEKPFFTISSLTGTDDILNGITNQTASTSNQHSDCHNCFHQWLKRSTVRLRRYCPTNAGTTPNGLFFTASTRSQNNFFPVWNLSKSTWERKHENETQITRSVHLLNERKNAVCLTFNRMFLVIQ